MDSFTENILARARERQKLLAAASEKSPLRECNKSVSQPSLVTCINNEHPDQQKGMAGLDSHSELNLAKSYKENRAMRTHFTSEASPQQKVLNFKNDNLDMEIKVTTTDTVRVEVQIEEEEQTCEDHHKGEGIEGLRPDVRHRLERLGQLYAGGDDANISSPIHRTEGKFSITEDEQRTDSIPSKDGISDSVTTDQAGQQQRQHKGGLRKLADLAENINKWEDGVTPTRQQPATSSTKKSWKQQAAPKPPTSNAQPVHATSSPSCGAAKQKSKAPSPPVQAGSVQSSNTKQIKWDTKVLKNLESQGFTRTDSNTRLVYNYDRGAPKSIVADRAAIFEEAASKSQQQKQTPSTKDPALLSVSERMALFERNKGTAPVPKAPFAMAAPLTPPARAPPKIVSTQMKLKDQTAVSNIGGNVASKIASLYEHKITGSQENDSNEYDDEDEDEDEMAQRRYEEVDEHVKMLSDTDRQSNDAKNVRFEPKSPGKRNNQADSPKVAAVLSEVKRIKVAKKHKEGRLYPSLSDIETVTETDNDDDDQTRRPSIVYEEDEDAANSSSNNVSSTENSTTESDVVNTSFGRDILKVVCEQQATTSQKRTYVEQTDSDDFSDILDEDNGYLDDFAAYKNHAPSPPKTMRGAEPSDSFKYRRCTPPKTSGSSSKPTETMESGTPVLKYTVSVYRKQQQEQLNSNSTPVRRIVRLHQELTPPEEEGSCQSETNQSSNESESSERKQLADAVVAYIDELLTEQGRQEMIMSQTSQALNLCNSTPEFSGSTEQVEAEKVLLLAAHRRQATVHELQRLKVENSLRPKHYTSCQKGTVTISKIVLPLKSKYVSALKVAGGKGDHVVCLIKCADKVVCTKLVSTNSKSFIDMEISIPGSYVLNDVYSEATLTLDIYSLAAHDEVLPHNVKYHISKKGSSSTNSKLTPRKCRLLTMGPSRKQSPGGPSTVRSSSFALMGCVVVSLQSTNKKCWHLMNTPSMSPFEGTVEMLIRYDPTITIEHRGFLTMFEDVSGFGAWHRRWCLLKGQSLSYWKYPDDERKSVPINTIDLSAIITKHAAAVSRDICARPHTFLLERERPAKPTDRETLVVLLKGDKTVIRHLLSADTKEERIEWCEKINIILNSLKTNGDSTERSS